VSVFDCPNCGARVHADPAGEVCDAPFPDSDDTRCQLRPHADGEHDPEHYGLNPHTGAPVRWRASEFGS